MIKGSIQEEDITLINMNESNIGAPKYKKKKRTEKKQTKKKQILTDIKGEIGGNTIIVGDFNMSLTSMNRSSRQKINKATEILNRTVIFN